MQQHDISTFMDTWNSLIPYCVPEQQARLWLFRYGLENMLATVEETARRLVKKPMTPEHVMKFVSAVARDKAAAKRCQQQVSQ